jgi:hypothetical protein
MAGEGYPGPAPTQSAAALLLRLTGAATLAAGALLYGDGDATLATLSLGAQNTVLVAGASAPAWSTSLALTSTIASKQAAAAGISLDHNLATGNFTLRLSPAATLGANRRWTFPDRDDTAAGLGAQTFTGAQTISSTLGVSGNVTLSAGGLAFGSATASAGQLAFYTNGNTAYFGNFGNAPGNEVGFSVLGIVGYKFHTTTYAHTFVNGIVSISNATASTSTTTGSLVNAGGFGCAGAGYFGGSIVSAAGVMNSDVAGAFGTPGMLLVTAGNSADTFVAGSYGNDAVGAHLYGFKTRSTSSSADANTAVTTGDQLVVVAGYGASPNADYRSAGTLSLTVDAAPSGTIIPGKWTLATRDGAGTMTDRLAVNSVGSTILGAAAIATSATDGFLYVPACAGAPSGVPTAVTGRVPIVVDSTNNKLYFYSGGAWRDAGP